jgi:hypothetical protein
LDPLLKAADELQGKLRSLGKHSKSSRLCSELIQQGLGVFEACGVEAFGEPVVDSASMMQASLRRLRSREQPGTLMVGHSPMPSQPCFPQA